MKNYYYILGLENFASDTEIKVSYRKLSKKIHPDMNGGDKFFEERFKEILEAYETLSDSVSKQSYDNKLRAFYSANENNNTQSNDRRSDNPKQEKTSHNKNVIQINSRFKWGRLMRKIIFIPFILLITPFVYFSFYLELNNGFLSNFTDLKSLFLSFFLLLLCSFLLIRNLYSLKNLGKIKIIDNIIILYNFFLLRSSIINFTVVIKK